MPGFELPELLAALGFFGLFGVFPIVMVLLKHQRSMAEILHRNVPSETQHRIEMLEREVRELKAERLERLLRADEGRGLPSPRP